MRARDGRLVIGELPLRETEVRELQQFGMARQQAQHDFLSVNRRKRRDTQVELTIAPVIEDTPVLRQTTLRNIQVRHDLDLVDDRGVVAPIEHVFLDELAVDAQADATALLVGLEMDIARIFVERLADQIRQKSLSAADLAPIRRPACRSAGHLPAVVAVQQQGELVRPDRLDLYPESGQHLDLLRHGSVVAPPLSGAQHDPVPAVVRHEPVVPRFGGGKQLHDLGRNAFGKGHGSER